MKKIVINKEIVKCGEECVYYREDRYDEYCQNAGDSMGSCIIRKNDLHNKNFPSWCPLEDWGVEGE